MANRESRWNFALQGIIGILVAFSIWTYMEYVPLQKAEARQVALTEVVDHLNQMESLRRVGGRDAEKDYTFTERALSDLLGKDMREWVPQESPEKSSSRSEPEGYPSGVDDRVPKRNLW